MSITATETIEIFSATEAVRQSATEGKKLVLKDIVLDRINIPTRNKTFYSWKDMEDGIKRLQEMVERGQGYMYLDHPLPLPDNVPLVPNAHNLIARAAARATRISTVMPSDPNTGVVEVRADLNILNTQAGKDIQACLEDGGGIGFSKRGVLEKWEEQTIGTERVKVPVKYRFNAYELVIGQSVPGAETVPGNYVYEQNNNTQEVPDMELKDIKTLAELKASATVSLYEALMTEAKEQIGKESVSAEDIQRQITEAVEAATKPLKDKVTAQEAELAKFKTGMEAIIPALVDMGVVDQREESQVEKDLTTQLETLKQEKKALEDKITSLESAKSDEVLDTPEKIQKQVESELGDMDAPFKAAIIESMKKGKFASNAEFKVALESYKSVAEASKSTGAGEGVQENTDAANTQAADDKGAKKDEQALEQEAYKKRLKERAGIQEVTEQQ